MPKKRKKNRLRLTNRFKLKGRAIRIWFIFPQLKGLGHGASSDYFGLDGLQDAISFYEQGEVCYAESWIYGLCTHSFLDKLFGRYHSPFRVTVSIASTSKLL